MGNYDVMHSKNQILFKWVWKIIWYFLNYFENKNQDVLDKSKKIRIKNFRFIPKTAIELSLTVNANENL